jgi:hypothetical protein
VTAVDLDESVDDLAYSLQQYYGRPAPPEDEFPAGLDGALRVLFVDPGRPDGAARRPASDLIRRLERQLSADVYRWTGHPPERTRSLLHHLAGRADQLRLGYPEGGESRATVGLTTLVTALAMNHVRHGSYMP